MQTTILNVPVDNELHLETQEGKVVDMDERDIFDEWNDSEHADEFILVRILAFIEGKERRKEYDEAYIKALLALEIYDVSLSSKRNKRLGHLYKKLYFKN